ncbi:Hypothetical predicted protein [Mytilus galloprovincialis]|uniref:Uncharacterized protein n=1 Tax=Mytilus galloprovincialis TaxID=29158 RepID=A0A8B6FNE6_MYTGA|nr:Hypothetical predicted protein [Mytilus galloprovincialis]
MSVPSTWLALEERKLAFQPITNITKLSGRCWEIVEKKFDGNKNLKASTFKCLPGLVEETAGLEVLKDTDDVSKMKHFCKDKKISDKTTLNFEISDDVMKVSFGQKTLIGSKARLKVNKEEHLMSPTDFKMFFEDSGRINGESKSSDRKKLKENQYRKAEEKKGGMTKRKLTLEVKKFATKLQKEQIYEPSLFGGRGSTVIKACGYGDIMKRFSESLPITDAPPYTNRRKLPTMPEVTSEQEVILLTPERINLAREQKEMLE